MKDAIEFSQEELTTMMEGLLAGATIGDVVNIGQDNIEAGYGLAYSLYSAGNYKDAETMFKALCIYDHNDARFWMGLGGCRQAGGDLPGAIDAYAYSSYASALGDPAPVVHGALCYMKLGDKENAVNLFKAAVEMGTPGNSEHAVFHTRARAMLDMLEKGE
jgi:type III secretion low calcium response chaperone LcrH/SycD